MHSLSIRGINLVANISANSGLGVHARHIAIRLLEKGIQVDAYDVNAPHARNNSVVPEAIRLLDHPDFTRMWSAYDLITEERNVP